MSLSDYSSDDSLDEEPAVGVEVLKSVARSARTGGPSSMDSASKSMATAALAGLAMAGIAAGAVLLRKYFTANDSTGRKEQIRDRAEPDAEAKRELRRKRPVGGDVKGSLRETAPFMARTESTSSVGPLRKHPRRDTSEDSKNGEVSGASPKSGGTTDGHLRPLRKTPSTNGRHRRPPRRGAAPRGTSPAGTGSESEGNKAAPAISAKRESVSEASITAPVDTQEAGAETAASGKSAPEESAAALGSRSAAADSKAAPGLASPALPSTAAGAKADEKAAPGKAGVLSESASAAADGKVASEKFGPATSTDLMAKCRGAQPPQATLTEQESSKESADAGGQAAPEKGAAAAPTDLMAEHRVAQPAAQQGSSKGSAATDSIAATEEATTVAELSKQPEHAGAKATPEKALLAGKCSNEPASSSRKLPQNESFPDLVAPKITPAASLDTFTAEMDVLGQEVESAATTRSHGDNKPGAKSTAPADIKADSRAADEAKKADVSNAAAMAGSKADAATGAAAKPAADQEAASKAADKDGKGSGAESGKTLAEKTVDKDKAGSINAGEEGTPAGDLVAAAQAEIDKQDNLPAAKDLASPAVAESKSLAPKADATAPAGCSTTAKKPSGTVVAGPARSAKVGGSRESPVSGKVAAAVAGVSGAAAAAGAAAGGTDRGASRALSSEPSLVPDARAAAAGDDAGGASEEALDLCSVEADAVCRTVRDAAEEPAGGDASAATQGTSGEQHSGSTGKEGEAPEGNAGSDVPAEKDPEAGACDTAAGTPPAGQDATREAAKPSEEPAAEHGATSNTEGKSLEREDAPDEALAAGEPSKADGDGKASQETSGSREAEASEAPAKAAAYDPLGMEAAAEDLTEASAVKEAGNGHLQQEDGQATIEPQNQAESNVELNLAVALRIISEKGNLAAAERTLQKSLAAVKAGDGGPVRPHFRCRLAGTLADIIARSEQTAGLVAGKPKKDSASRSSEIVDLLRYGYEAALETGDGSLRARESWRLGAALAEAEDFEAAHALFQGELAHWEKQCGPADPRTQHSRTWLADVLVKLGRKEEAYKLLTGAAQALENDAQHASSSKPEEQAGKHARATDDSDVPGHDLSPTEAASVTAAKCYVHLANIQAGEEEWDTAVGNARKAVTIMEAAFGEANPRTSTAYGTLASILKHQKKEEGLREALGLYEKLQRIAETVHGLRNSHIAMAHRAIADVHMMLNEHGQAASHTEKAVQIAGAVHGRDHPIMESYWQAVAEAKLAAGDKEGAKEANRQALRVRSHTQRGGGSGRGPRAGGSLGGGRRGGRGRGRR